ncbi:MAG: carbohydrate-binding domain-containing protein [Erysipelotrichaceae bacterium]|nr:carbohydrate-binding domain-containing protein [Erysipelotrichaceae bacterium]
MKKWLVLLICTLLFVGCSKSDVTSNDDYITITLADNEILVDGNEISKDDSKAVYLANDIVYYEEGKDSSYGEGTDSDSHSIEEAKSHSVVHITKAGTYRLKGSLSKGQIAVDLGEDAEEDPNDVVTLLLDNVDITCEVAPAIIFYNVYESNSTSSAGANVELVNGSINNVNGSYVAKIFKPGTDKKLHKYDGAFYSKQSMIIDGDDGCLNIVAENEGLGSEMHLTINGGCIEIIAQNDGINVNEDDESIFTMNDGILSIDSGYGDEGDGIDSNGSLIINGGTVIAMCSDDTPDGGIDADLGITINGGTVIAFGRNGSINKDSKLNYISGRVDSTQIVVDQLFEIQTPRKYSSVLFSSSDIDKNGTYTINGNNAIINFNGGFDFPGGMGRPEGKGEFDPSRMPENFDPNNIPNDMKRPDGDFDPSKKPDDMMKA